MGLSKRSRGLTLMPRMGKERRQAPDRILARVVVFFGLALMVAGSARAERCRMYVGTYTDKDGEGIYSALLDMDTGEVGPLDLAVKTDNPSFLARDPGGDYLYAVNETQTFNGDPSGAVSVFSIGQGWGGVDLVQQVSSRGAAPAHLSLDQTGRFLLVANYIGGNVAVFPIEKNGRLGDPTALVQEAGSSVNRDRQTGPHAHFIHTTPDNRFALNADLGQDKIFVYRFNPSSGTLTASEPRSLSVKPGAGPRHVAFDPAGRFLYVLNELSSTVTLFAAEGASEPWRRIESWTTLPKTFSGPNTAAEIVLDGSGRNLYVSNRGHDSLCQFNVHPETGRLNRVAWVSTKGQAPRHFALDPSGKWLFAANQNSNTLQPFRVHPKNGRLTAAGAALSVPSPVCVIFSNVLVATGAAAVLPSAQEEVGNDPTVIRSRFELGDEYFNNAGGPDWHLATLRIDGAPTPKLGFRLDVPYMFLVPEGYPYDLKSGLADVMVRGTAVLKKTPRAGFTGFCDFWFDTAESTNFGLGKYSAGPGLAVSLMNPYKDMMLSTSLQHKFSYAGDSSRTDISRTRMELIMDKSFQERQWIVLNPVIFMDWISGKSAGDLEVETGIRLGDHWNAWVRPGVGLWGQEVSGGYNSYCQAGVRYMFGEPLRKKILNDLGLR
jgi:6-phosphogluconolactonase